MAIEGAVHRPGALKQTNKTHKTGKHRSKGEIDNLNKGINLSRFSFIIFFYVIKLQVEFQSK